MSSESQPSDAPTAEARARNRQRFELELEFVQALANPFYLHSLAQQGIMTQQAFVNYLSYLQYWKRKEYARFVMYPHALHHLDLLQNERFRLGLSEDGLRDYLNQTQFDHWRTWREPEHLSGLRKSVTEETPAPDSAVPPLSATTVNGLA
ncbi:SOH1 family protein [Peniophora sp. CONT]|nr:SOH1 family protein [Peniophora sp. CONT]